MHVRVSLFAIVALLALSCATSSTAAARGLDGSHQPIVRFIGQVTEVGATGGEPITFTLQTRRRLVPFRIAPYATFTALSAEAEVEGLATDDYAVVEARHVRRIWVAVHIAFDVQPIQNDQIVLNATIIRTSPNGQAVFVRLPSGEVRRVTIVARTRFKVSGQITDVPPTFVRGDTVSITMKPVANGWIAIEIDLNQSAFQPYSFQPY